MGAREIAAREGILPDRQPRAGGAPDFDRFAVGPGAWSNPFQQVENQGFDGIVHVGSVSLLCPHPERRATNSKMKIFAALLHFSYENRQPRCTGVMAAI